MIPEALYLKGFAGIRAGLNRDELSLDLARLADDARLVALAGPNGAGKTTVMDNLQPYRLLPSRASSFGPAGFSFYEHLVLPESMKELVWRHAGCRYRSTLMFRMNGRRKGEAYLHTEQDGRWLPVKLSDGTVSDGRAETYDACLEALLGKPETFFTSVFAAQNRRPLASYTPGEVKTLMVELLGLEQIRQMGEKASQVVRLLRNTLDERRRTVSGFGDVERRISELDTALGGCRQQLVQRTREKAIAQAEAVAAQVRLARLVAERESAQAVEERRSTLNVRLAAARESLAKVLAGLTQDREREAARLARTAVELREAGSLARQQLAAVAKRREEAQQVLSQRETIARAIERARTIADDERRLRARLEAAQARHDAREGQSRTLAVLRTRAESLRREAGDAALRAAGLRQRLGLTAMVPCRGTELQERCELLADAREAKALLPSADNQLATIRLALDALKVDVRALEGTVAEFGDTAAAIRAAQSELDRLTEERRCVDALAAQQTNLEQAEQRIAECVATEQEITDVLARAEERCARESEQARTTIDAIDQRIGEQTQSGQGAIDSIVLELASLPPVFDLARLVAGRAAMQAAQARIHDHDAALLLAAKEDASLQAELAMARSRAAQAIGSRVVLARIEGELGWWNLLAKALGNDGVIALCVDDAGPELARLANELLLACYGSRFTLSIRTQVETAKKELREGFDVVVYDAETGQAKSVGVMSGGERIWINEALTRAIALYLAQTTGRRYETLFCDEADGALDGARKRMFMQMKREVLRLGGYEREFFVSQSPELTQMADAVIDLAELANKA